MNRGTPDPDWFGERIELPQDGLTLRYERSGDVSRAEFEQVLEVLRRAFNGGPSWFSLAATPLDHLLWKTVDRPVESIVQLTEVGDRLVGYEFNAMGRFLVRGAETLVRQGYDSALDPEFQGRGIDSLRGSPGEQVRRNTTAGLSVGVGMHPTSRTRRGVGQGTLFENGLDTLIKPLSVRGLLGRRTGRGRGASGSSRTREVLERQAAGRGIKPRLRRLAFGARLALGAVRPTKRGPRDAGWQIRTIDQFDERADALWDRAAEAFDFIQIRDREYLNWRYCDGRGGPFVVRVLEQDGVLLGYAALRADAGGAVLGDLLAVPDRLDVAEALIADAIAIGRARGAPLVRCWMPRAHPYRELLSEFGFARYETPITFNYRPREMDPEALAFLAQPGARVHFMIADTDHM